MSEAALPENVEEWPRDPFALFGVSHSISQRDLKRVYTRLIRLYKPERLPEQFRRVREAYETLLPYAAWNDARGLETEGAPDAQTDSAQPQNPELKESVSQTERPAPESAGAPERNEAPDSLGSSESTSSSQTDSATSWSTPPRIEERVFEDPWRQAIRGKVELAYKSIQEARIKNPARPANYIQLYWLLAACRELDASRRPHEWLLDALSNCQQDGRLLDLWSEELTADPELALTVRFAEVIDRAPTSLLADLLERRWQAVARLQRWDLVSVDLDKFGKRLCRDDEAAWFRLLMFLAALSFLARPQDIASMVRLCEERIKELSHLALSHGDAFDRAEFLSHLARESESAGMLPWRRGKSSTGSALTPEVVFQILYRHVAGEVHDIAELVEPFLAAVCAQPIEALFVFDQIASRLPASAVEFGRAIDWLSWNCRTREVPSHSEPIARELSRRIVYDLDGNYGTIRLQILRRCCEEAVSPEHVYQTLREPPIAIAEIAEQLAADYSLRLTYQCYRLGWSM